VSRDTSGGGHEPRPSDREALGVALRPYVTDRGGGRPAAVSGQLGGTGDGTAVGGKGAAPAVTWRFTAAEAADALVRLVGAGYVPLAHRRPATPPGPAPPAPPRRGKPRAAPLRQVEM
jgi:hypothetical protein